MSLLQPVSGPYLDGNLVVRDRPALLIRAPDGNAGSPTELGTTQPQQIGFKPDRSSDAGRAGYA
jgi:hypothetical protein